MLISQDFLHSKSTSHTRTRMAPKCARLYLLAQRFHIVWSMCAFNLGHAVLSIVMTACTCPCLYLLAFQATCSISYIRRMAASIKQAHLPGHQIDMDRACASGRNSNCWVQDDQSAHATCLYLLACLATCSVSFIMHMAADIGQVHLQEHSMDMNRACASARRLEACTSPLMPCPYTDHSMPLPVCLTLSSHIREHTSMCKQ